MNLFYDTLKTIYIKEKLVDLTTIYDNGLAIGITRVLGKDKDNLPALMQVIDSLFFISPSHYLCLLYFLIPKKSFVPKTFKLLTEDEKDDIINDKVKQLLDLSNAEMIKIKEILKAQLTDRKYWKERLGV